MALGEPLENGWPRCAPADCDTATVPGTPLQLLLQRGVMFPVAQAFLRDMNAYIEPVMNSRGITDEGSWTPNNSVATSNHNGATAWDYNWTDHPMGPKAPDPAAGWNGSVLIDGDQTPAVRALLRYYTTAGGLQLIWWGNDWNTPWDSMHFQYGYGTYERQSEVAAWAAEHIRPDGYSKYRRGEPGQPVPRGGLTADVLASVMLNRVGMDRYAALLPGLQRCFQLAECDTVNRRAALIGQLFAESGGLRWQEEIASGAAYEGRCSDLGNCQPGDGVRYKGRDFIQVTGRAHYRDLSLWAYQHGQVPTPTFFVDNPGLLATDPHAFLGVVWYWTVARPMNALVDAGPDAQWGRYRGFEAVTAAVNGGLNGLTERRDAYQRALAQGNNLLDPEDNDPVLEMLMSDVEVDSWSIYATPGEPKIPLVNLLRAVDANNHRELVEAMARKGDTDSLSRIVRAANGQGSRTDPATVAYATSVLADIKATTPDIWTAYLKRIGAV